MQATIATDASGPVQYQFYRAAPPGSTSLFGWQTDSNFTDTGLTENTVYSYQVRARDAVGNVTVWSIAQSATTSTTIQGQINEAKIARQLVTPGQYPPVTVTIAAGMYYESVQINEPNITLKSATGAAITIIDAGASYQQAIEISGDNVTIDGSPLSMALRPIALLIHSNTRFGFTPITPPSKTAP
jgi:hypothetical protein